uniref:Chromophore lyase CpcS/CpeS homolog n=1 Tax=Gracilaria vermiculophylla TaxID=2608709 RepID=A0A345U8X7_9FLOR|nr:hypothetical protein [Gracilaria vermiculophylla]AXI96913.1 hypothetical protein [Gracilaria vermiculophylla]QXU75119.1 hypothetical protein [Gracilaria vermiculophylla]WDZ67990.1 hypothetical protein [Gracilaria vermiculophylla]
MTYTYNKILDQLEGRWICQRTNYIIGNKQINYHKEELKFKQISNIYKTQIDSRLLYQYQLYDKNKDQKACYLFFQQEESEFDTVHKITNDKVKYYRLKIHTHNSIKIKSVKQNIVYYEYIYLINPRFKIIISILRKNQKYLAISFISEIRISH